MKARHRYAAALWLLAAGTVCAGAPDGAPAHKADGAYLDARNELVADRPSVTRMRSATAAVEYRVDNWMALVAVEAMLIRATRHGSASRLRSLEGLNPSRYLLYRRPEPDVARELNRMRELAPLMMDLYLAGLNEYRWSSPEAAPMERRALVRGLLGAIGRSGHRASVFFLAHVAADGCVRGTSCDAVIAALGDTGSAAATAVLAEIGAAARGKGDVEREAMVLHALGRIRREEAWPHIEQALAHPAASVRAAAARAAGSIGSCRYWRRASASGEVLKEAAAAALVELLVTEQENRVAAAVLASIGRMSTSDLRSRIELELAYLPDDTQAAGSNGARSKVRERLHEAAARLDC